ncbi:hypothetical protein VTO42DRAFT_6004 [Malbranchea cinnamomea]
MSPRLNLFSARSLFRSAQCPFTSFRFSRDSILQHSYKHCAKGAPTFAQSTGQRRVNTTSSKQDQTPEDAASQEPRDSTQDPLPDVSGEAAEIARIMKGETCSVDGEVGGPELEQGSPVLDVLKRDKDALKNMPKVLRDQLAASSCGNTSGTRSFSTSARTSQMETQKQAPTATATETAAEPTRADIAEMIAATEQQLAEQPQQNEGHMFGIPPIPIPRSEHLKRRYDPLVEHFTKMMMHSGKLALAQRQMDQVLEYLRTSPPPRLDPRLLPGPDAQELPLNPVAYLTLVVDSVAPLLKIRQQKGAAGGGRSLPIPVPLSQRQRRRTAIKWIIEQSDKRRDPEFAKRLAQEIVAVAEGKSPVWDKRAQVHKAGTSARVNVAWKPPTR